MIEYFHRRRLISNELVYNGKKIIIDSGTVTGCHFSKDGTKLYTNPHNVYKPLRHIMSTPFDVSTATTQTASTVGAGTSRGLYISEDGTKMFIGDSATDDLQSFSLSSAFDVTTLASVATFSLTDLGLSDLWISPLGNRLYIIDDEKIKRYTFGTEFDVTTLSFDHEINLFTAEQGVCLSPDETNLYVNVDLGDEWIYQYELLTPGDLTTTSFLHATNISSALDTDGNFDSLGISDDGTKMIYSTYATSGTDASHYTFTLTDPFNLGDLVIP